MAESKDLGKSYVSTEHLLLAIIRDGELDSSKGTVKVLLSLGVDIKELERNVRERINWIN